MPPPSIWSTFHDPVDIVSAVIPEPLWSVPADDSETDVVMIHDKDYDSDPDSIYVYGEEKREIGRGKKWIVNPITYSIEIMIPILYQLRRRERSKERVVCDHDPDLVFVFVNGHHVIIVRERESVSEKQKDPTLSPNPFSPRALIRKTDERYLSPIKETVVRWIFLTERDRLALNASSCQPLSFASTSDHRQNSDRPCPHGVHTETMAMDLGNKAVKGVPQKGLRRPGITPPEYIYWEAILATGRFSKIYPCAKREASSRDVLKQLVVKKMEIRLVKSDDETHKQMQDRVAERHHMHGICIRAEECGQYPCFPEVFDWAVASDAGYLVMERAHHSFDTFKESLASLPLSKAIKFLQSMTSALCVLEMKGILHLGIQPSNILVKAVGCEWVFMLSGFGSSLKLRADKPIRRPRTFTAGYTAPEIMSPLVDMPVCDITCAADMWSMGAVFADLLTGGFPELDNEDWTGLNFPEEFPIEGEVAVKRMMLTKPRSRITPKELKEVVKGLVDKHCGPKKSNLVNYDLAPPRVCPPIPESGTGTDTVPETGADQIPAEVASDGADGSAIITTICSGDSNDTDKTKMGSWPTASSSSGGRMKIAGNAVLTSSDAESGSGDQPVKKKRSRRSLDKELEDAAAGQEVMAVIISADGATTSKGKLRVRKGHSAGGPAKVYFHCPDENIIECDDGPRNVGGCGGRGTGDKARLSNPVRSHMKRCCGHLVNDPGPVNDGNEAVWNARPLYSNLRYNPLEYIPDDDDTEQE